MMLNRRQILQGGGALLATRLYSAAPRDFGITRAGDVPVTADSPATLFTKQDDFMYGEMHPRYKSNCVQLVRQRGGGPFVVQPGVANQHPLPSSGIGWVIPFHLADASQSDTCIAVLVKEPLPPGLVLTPARWRQIMHQTDPVQLNCASFGQSRLRLTRVGNRVPIPGVPVPVSNFEEVAIALQDVPRGALAQLLVQPTDNSRRWASSHVEVTQDLQLISTAYFGRTILDRISKSELDLHSRFWLSGVITSYPLPVRGDGGIDTLEWLKLTRFVKATSPKVDVVRAILPDELRVRVTRVGASNDGTHWLANPVERVEGTFAAGPHYAQPSREIITLLVRSRLERSWHVAGSEYLTRNRAYWMIPTADLQPGGTDAKGEYVAIAVVSYQPFDESRPVTEFDLRRIQVSISDEVRYLLSQAGK